MGWTQDSNAVEAPVKKAVKWTGNLKLKTHRRTVPIGPKSYAEKLDGGLSLVYRRYTHIAEGWNGSWTARLHIGGTKYAFKPLGLADERWQ
jgi:hypothetical protein